MGQNIKAFPSNELNGDGSIYYQHNGMTLRDYLANSAMQASLTSPELMQVVSKKGLQDGSAFDAVARVSYKIADAMLKQREL